MPSPERAVNIIKNFVFMVIKLIVATSSFLFDIFSLIAGFIKKLCQILKQK